MVELTLQDKVMAVMLESDNDDSTERILCPLTVQDVYEAEKAVKNYASNAGISALLIKFPYHPMQHNLPVVQLVERELDFHKWKPELPTQGKLACVPVCTNEYSLPWDNLCSQLQAQVGTLGRTSLVCGLLVKSENQAVHSP